MVRLPTECNSVDFVSLLLITDSEQRKKPLKGIVQRKLRCVENGINRQVLLWCWGAGHSFLILKGHHLGFYKKRFATT
jgi:hypothetical protein